GGVLSDLGLSEVEVTWRDMSVRIARTLSAPGVPASPAGGGAALTSGTSDMTVGSVPDGTSALVTVEAPMVGIFYRVSSPTAAPYVREDETVREGQNLC